MPSFSGSNVIVTVSSTPLDVVRPPPNDLGKFVPPGRRSPSSPAEPNPPPPIPAADAPAPLDGPYEPQPPVAGSVRPSTEFCDGAPAGSSPALVVKVLLVRAGSARPLMSGFAAVIALSGVASFWTSCVWPLCKAGAAHGSASRFSKESFRRRRDLLGDSEGELWDGFCTFGDESSRFSDILAFLT